MMWLRSKRVWLGAGIVVLVPVVALAWYLLSPLFFDKTVEEEFPFAFTAEVPKDMTMSEVEDVMKTMAKVDSEMKEPMSKMMGGIAKAAEPASAQAVEPVAVNSGQFKDAGRHKGQGTATVYRLPDDSSVLRLESLKVDNGPDLHVILTTHNDPDGRGDVHQEGYVDLGKLKGNIGNQNYEIPDDVDASTFNAVVIYCKPFHVIFSVAPLQ